MFKDKEYHLELGVHLWATVKKGDSIFDHFYVNYPVSSLKTLNNNKKNEHKKKRKKKKKKLGCKRGKTQGTTEARIPVKH